MAEPILARRIELPGRGGAVAAYEIGPAGRPIDLVFSHANGFNARTYLSILAPVAETRRILLPDIRGHGRTELPAETAGRSDWTDARDDLLALLEALDLRDVTLAGHSMGATVSLLAAAQATERVRDLVLFEPVIMPTGATGEPADSPMVVGTLKRRADFAGREEAIQAYTGRGAFRSWTPQMLQDYATDGFRDLADGAVTLAAAPAWEHSNYVAQAHDARGALAAVQAPVRLFRAEKGSTVGATPHELQALKPDLRQDAVPETTHFLPMERPDVVAGALAP